MKRTLIVTGAMALLAGGCTDASAPAAPTPPAAAALAAAPSAARQVPVDGAFAALVDFTTISLTPRGRNCLLEVDGQLEFSGTIEGTATGTTTALVFATCEEAASTPPGTHPDVFKSELEFTGTVAGQPATANVLYMGRVQPGGTIDGRLVFSNGIAGRLEVEGVVAVGGTYRGQVVVR